MSKPNPIHLGYQRSTEKYSGALPLGQEIYLKADGTPFLSPHGYFYFRPIKVAKTGASSLIGKPIRLSQPVILEPKWKRKAKDIGIHLAKMFFVALVAGAFVVLILGIIDHYRARLSYKAFIWPIEPPNVITPSWASGPKLDDLEIEPLNVEGQESGQIFRGKASWYGHGAACIGCDKNEIMANGEKFDERDLTIAMNHLPMNTLVMVVNEDNGKRVLGVRVTDTGCFNQKGRDMNAAAGVDCSKWNHLDRIADLSKAVGESIDFVPENSNNPGSGSTIRIEVLPTMDRVFSSN